jgi:hypothetical protein
MLTKEQLQEAATKYNISLSAIQSIIAVESGGSGFLPDGRPKILFEGHIFWKELVKIGIDPNKFVTGNEDVLYKVWTKSHYVGGAGEHVRLAKASLINREAALKSASWGLFQIMGGNYISTGDKTVVQFVLEESASEVDQLDDFLNFITTTQLIQYLKVKNWARFAAGYNGPSYKANNYDVRLQQADAKFC